MWENKNQKNSEYGHFSRSQIIKVRDLPENIFTHFMLFPFIPGGSFI